MAETDTFKTNFGSFIQQIFFDCYRYQGFIVIQKDENLCSYGNYILLGRQKINKMNK